MCRHVDPRRVGADADFRFRRELGDKKGEGGRAFVVVAMRGRECWYKVHGLETQIRGAEVAV